MSASPSAGEAVVPAMNTKRPLDDESSQTGPNDQPEAKRPALGKEATEEDNANNADTKRAVAGAAATGSADETDAVQTASSKAVGLKNGTQEPRADHSVQNAARNAAAESGNATSNEESASRPGGEAQDQSTPAPQAQSPAAHQDESEWLHMRAVITSAEAATVIGKGGENVSQIRRSSGAKCTVSDYSRGAVERVLTVSGMVDAAAKAFSLIVRTLNNEPLDAASTAQSKTYPLRLLVPHILIGSIIGKSGVRIREIQEASGARLNASDSCLPLSTERSLIVLGVADAVHIATYYVGQTLVEQLTERFGGPAASAYATRSGGPAGVVPGGMQVVPYVPQPAGGQYGHPDNFRRHHPPGGHRSPSGPYGMPYSHGPTSHHSAVQPPMHFGGSAHHPHAAMGGPAGGPGYMGAGPHQPHLHPHQPMHGHAGPPNQPVQGIVGGQPLTQQIFIPNDMVGAIIGKGGAKINEIRQLSGSVIKINEPQDNSNERLVTITGTSDCNQMALYMLYSRLESEKHRM